MKHRQTNLSFGLEIVPMGTGLLAKYLRESDLDVGAIFQRLAETLFPIPLVLANKFRFQLVNVFCSSSGFSFGLCPPPPASASPLACTWLFTFSLDGQTYGDVEPDYNSMRGINVRIWGHAGSKFLTIGLDHTSAQKYGLKSSMLAPRYAYCLVGMLVKSFMLRHRYFDQSGEPDYESSFKNLLPSLTYSSLYMMPLSNLISSTPYHLWVFNRHVWGTASFLLSKQQVTPSSLLYYIVYVGYCEELKPEVEEKIFDLFSHSYLSCLQRSRDGRGVENKSDLLYPALVHRNEIPVKDDWMTWLSEKDLSGLETEVNVRQHVRQLFYR